MRNYKKYAIRRRVTYEGTSFVIYADNEKQYAEKVAKKIQEIESGRKISGGNTLLKIWAKECIETYKTGQSDLTRKKYISAVNNLVLKEIGDMPIKTITPMHCQKTLNKQLGKSQYTINQTYQILQFLFEKAVINNLIKENPAQNIEKGKGYKTKRRAITDFEREHIIKVASSERRYYLYLLMLFCGCRPSEAGEAMGKDIQKLQGVNVLHIRGTKTANADRIVPIPNELYNVIKNTPLNEHIAQNTAGNPIKYDKRGRLWNSFKRQLNISMGCKIYRNELIPPFPVAPDLVPYCLRHTYCTDLARKGIDIRTAQKLMGHSDITLTANIYTNLDNNDIVLAAKMLNDNTNDNTEKGRKRSGNAL